MMKMKRWLSVVLCIMLCISVMPAMVYATEPMTVKLNGQELISGQKVQCGEGTIEFDSANNILTLDNATISESSTEPVLRIQGQGGVLTIKLLGNNKISSTSENYFPIAIGNADVTIQGTNADTLTLESNSDSLNGSHCNLTIDGCTVNVTSHNWGGIVTGGGVLSIKNKAAVTINSYDPAIWSENGIQIADSSVFATANGDRVNTITSYGDISVSNSIVEVKGTSSAAYPALYAAGNININNQTTLTAESNGMRGIFTDSSMTVDDSTVTASGETDEGMVVVDTLSVNNSKVVASGRPDSMIPAIVTYHLEIDASDITAKGGIQLWDFDSGETTERTFIITPADGKLMGFKVDGTNWDGSAAVHFKEGAKSPYAAAMIFSEKEMNWLDAYRYIHIGEHIHSGGEATCTEKAVCDDCGSQYGDYDPDNHKAVSDWKSDSEKHWKECTACGKKMNEAAHTGGTATSTKRAVCDICGAEYGEVSALNQADPVKPEEKPVIQFPSSSEIRQNSVRMDSKTSVKAVHKSLKVRWKKVDGADGYDIYAAVCGGKFEGIVKSVEGDAKSVTIKKIAGKTLKTKQSYKVKVKAYRMVDGKKVYIANGRTLHVVFGSNAEYTNAGKVRVNKKNYTLKEGKTAKIRASIVKQDKTKKLLSKGHGAKLTYVSTDTAVAKVSKNGKITAKKKGKFIRFCLCLNLSK